jgi:predicted nucleic acid-binding protein
MLFVYWIEENPTYAKRMKQIVSRMKERHDQLCTSTFAIGEVLVGPHKMHATVLVEQIRRILSPPFVEVIPFTLETADHYAAIRAAQAVSPPDAIHLACAAATGIDLFLTNDKNLVGRVIPGIQFIASLDTQLF